MGERDSYSEPEKPSHARLFFMELGDLAQHPREIAEVGLPPSFDCITGDTNIYVKIEGVAQALKAQIVTDKQGRSHYTIVSGFPDESVLLLDYSTPGKLRGGERISE